MTPARTNETRLYVELMSHSFGGSKENSELPKLVVAAKPSQQSAPMHAPAPAVVAPKLLITIASTAAVTSPHTNTVKYISGIDFFAASALSSSSVLPMSAIHGFAKSTGEYHRPPSMKMTMPLTSTAR